MILLRAIGLIPGGRWLLRKCYAVEHPALEREVFGIKFANPVGLAAGFDRNGEAFRELAALGFGFVEVGTVTPRPQAGNPRPRVFRLPKDEAIINRIGLSNRGLEKTIQHLRRPHEGFIVGCNIGRNTATPAENAAADYLKLFRNLYQYADYFTVNISCDNSCREGATHTRAHILRILDPLFDFRRGQNQYRPIMLKVSPDMPDAVIDEISDILLETPLDGIVATNGTHNREGLHTSRTTLDKIGSGRLSGAPLTQRAVEVVRRIHTRSGGNFPIIGVGGIGKSSYHFISNKDCRLVAVCDVDRKHLESAVALGQKKFGETLEAYSDFRCLITDPNIDIVHIATPPHWHGIMAVEAAKAGKDIWCEKPMTRTIGEGKRVAEAVRRNNRIFRLNTWFRFKDTFYGLGTTVEPLKKLIDSGLLGWPLKVTISGTTGFTWKFFWVGRENLAPEPVPAELDYDMWLGPAPYKPYNKHRVHSTFRGYWDYDGGGLTDMGQHYMDPVQYLLGKDETSPVKIEVDAPQQHPDAVGIWRKIVYTYDDGCQIVLEGEGFESEGDTPYIEGPLGKVYKGFRCTIPDVMEKLAEMPDPELQNTDFLECVRTRRKFALDEQIGHRSSTLVNLGACALRLNRTLHFDPDTQLFIGDDAANRLIDQPMRGPWHI